MRTAIAMAATCVLGVAACAGETSAGPPMAELEAGEDRPGGATTNMLLLGSNAFSRPAANLSEEHLLMFYSGNGFFNESWVEAPASTTARDGLGPTFNARSCSGCHFKDGRGRPFDEQGNGLGLLLRLSVPGAGPHGEAIGDDIYGGQLQDRAIPGVLAEGTVQIAYADVAGQYDDGEPYTLRRPTYSIGEPAFGPLPADLMISPRVAPQMIGMGLLEAVPEQRLAELADPDDEDSDGISGRINRVWDVERAEVRPGRFGWKAEQPTVLQQSAGAFLGDMGISSRLFSDQNCPGAQEACVAAASGGAPEIANDLLDRVGVYAASVAVPARRGAADAPVRQGKFLFGEAGCTHCHTPSHTTADAAIAELTDQRIWPYTDLLLHDMGDELSDERPSFEAEGNEWRTPPLWGIGLFQSVNDHQLLLHDGRARGVAEAILWHAGEAEAARDAFRAMPAADREALISFVESL